MVTQPPTAILTAVQIAAMLGYTTRDGQPKPRRIHELYRLGKFPAPIDPSLSTVSWRWSPRAVEAYIAGEWRRQA